MSFSSHVLTYQMIQNGGHTMCSMHERAKVPLTVNAQTATSLSVPS